MCSSRYDLSIVLDIGRTRVSVLLPLVTGPLLLPLGRDFFNRGSWGGHPHRLDARSNWGSKSVKGTLVHHPHSFGPKIGQGFILLSPHLGIHSLVEFGRHSCHRKTLVKKNKKIKKKGGRKKATESKRTNLTLTLFLFNIYILQDVGKQFWTKAIEGKSSRIHQIIEVLDRPRLLNHLLNVSLVPALKLGLSLNCTKQWQGS